MDMGQTNSILCLRAQPGLEMCQQVCQKHRGTQGVREPVRGRRWRGEGSVGGLGNLRESGWSGQECNEVTHRYRGMMTEESWKEGKVKHKNDTSVYYVRVLSPNEKKKSPGCD